MYGLLRGVPAAHGQIVYSTSCLCRGKLLELESARRAFELQFHLQVPRKRVSSGQSESRS